MDIEKEKVGAHLVMHRVPKNRSLRKHRHSTADIWSHVIAQDLLWIAREGLKAPLPDSWKPWFVSYLVPCYVCYVIANECC